MRIVFKVMSVLIIISAVIALIGVGIAIAGGGALFSASGGSSLVGAGAMIIVLSMIPTAASALLSFFAAWAGFRDNMDQCKKLAGIILILVILDLVLVIFTKGSLGSALFKLLFYGFYYYLAQSRLY